MKRTNLWIALLAVANLASAAPWTYRGTLNDGGKPANGQYDLRLTLDNEAGTQSVTQPIPTR
jgi:trimeric autotransporter adhesin